MKISDSPDLFLYGSEKMLLRFVAILLVYKCLTFLNDALKQLIAVSLKLSEIFSVDLSEMLFSSEQI
jgi:hypothetical protein